MHEETLRQFFIDAIPAEELGRDLVGSLVHEGPVVTKHPIVDMKENFTVTPGHLVRLCDAVLSGAIEPEYLQAVGFSSVASARFTWDGDSAEGERVSAAVHDWAAPRINYPLTRANVKRFRLRLQTGTDTLKA